MENIFNLIEAERAIVKLEKRIDFLNAKGGLAKYFNLARVTKEFNRLTEKQFRSVDDHLSKTDDEYIEIVKSNLKLLETDSIKFIVYDHNYSIFGTYTKRIEGDIHNNGYSYSYSTKTNIALLPFESMRYPTKMSGKVDHWGRLDLRTKETSYALFKTLPKEFIGFIGPNGLIEIENTKNGWDVLSHGSFTIGKLIANHFDGDEGKNEQFIENKFFLKEKIEEFRRTKCRNKLSTL